MRCKEFEKLLPRYWAGELQPSEQGAFENHRETCETCRGLLDVHRATSPLWNRLPEVEPSPFVWNRIVSQLKSDSEVHSKRAVEQAVEFFRSLFSPKPAFALGVIVLLAIIGALMWQRHSRSVRIPTQIAQLLSNTREKTERRMQPDEPTWQQLPDVLGAASAVLSETQRDTRSPSVMYLPAKSEIVVREFARFPVERMLNQQLSPLLSDVEIALTELSTANYDSNPGARVEEVRRMVKQKDLLARLAVARSLVGALSVPEKEPPELIEAFTRPAQ